MSRYPNRSGADDPNDPHVAQIVAKNFATLEVAYGANTKYLTNYVQRILGSYDAAADVVSEAHKNLLVALLKKDGLLSPKEVRKMLTRIVHNLAVDELRKRSRLPLEYKSEILDSHESRSTVDLENVEFRMMMERLCADAQLSELETKIAWRLLEDDNLSSVARYLGVRRADVVRTVERLKRQMPEVAAHFATLERMENKDNA